MDLHGHPEPCNSFSAFLIRAYQVGVLRLGDAYYVRLFAITCCVDGCLIKLSQEMPQLVS